MPATLQNDESERLAEAFGQFLADYLGSAVDLSVHAAVGNQNTDILAPGIASLVPIP
ncbi:hypothetical protein GR158_23545 [Shinella sp. AETb1-6]|uniref:hypothetical protein n=1 Tax=Shinella TaxID=323620 RepID=UPI0013693ACB|nr:MULTISPECIES: hypothetical protein [Shinella]MCD1266731.1 hypothetical protein [Shinella sumterensis]MXN54082.1 hypothetical protein [Shinella sp. AETb1-6]